MFKKKDYREYFSQLYKVELAMKKECEGLLEVIKDPQAREILNAVRRDEIRHAKIVKNMIKLVK